MNEGEHDEIEVTPQERISAVREVVIHRNADDTWTLTVCGEDSAKLYAANRPTITGALRALCDYLEGAVIVV